VLIYLLREIIIYLETEECGSDGCVSRSVYMEGNENAKPNGSGGGGGSLQRSSLVFCFFVVSFRYDLRQVGWLTHLPASSRGFFIS